MGHNQHSSAEPAWLWEWTWKERSGVLPPLDESPLRQDSVTATKFCGSWAWRVAQQRGLEELGSLRPAGGGILFPKKLFVQIPALFIVRLRLWGQSCAAAWALAVLLICTSRALLKGGGILEFMQSSRV